MSSLTMVQGKTKLHGGASAHGAVGHWVNPSFFSFQPLPYNWCNKGNGIFYPVWDGVYKRTLAGSQKSC